MKLFLREIVLFSRKIYTFVVGYPSLRKRRMDIARQRPLANRQKYKNDRLPRCVKKGLVARRDTTMGCREIKINS